MTARSAFERARHDLVYAHERGTNLADPFLSALPVYGASVSVLSSRIGQATVSASDTTAVRLDELQFDLGEGPCWTALSTRAPVLEAELSSSSGHDWPQFLHALRDDDISESVGAMFAFPLAIGVLEIGAVDLWNRTPVKLTLEQVRNASALASLAGWQVLRRILGNLPELEESGASIRSRREIHQATGMVLVQLNVGPDDAALLLKAHAYASGRSLAEVAADVIERRLVFDANDAGDLDWTR